MTVKYLHMDIRNSGSSSLQILRGCFSLLCFDGLVIEWVDTSTLIIGWLRWLMIEWGYYFSQVLELQKTFQSRSRMGEKEVGSPSAKSCRLRHSSVSNITQVWVFAASVWNTSRAMKGGNFVLFISGGWWWRSCLQIVTSASPQDAVLMSGLLHIRGQQSDGSLKSFVIV